MPLSQLRGYRSEAYAVVAPAAAPRYYALFLDTDIVAAVYGSDGARLADRGSLSFAGSYTPSAENGALIAADPEELVGAGALAWRSEDNELTVWDVAGDVTHTYAAAASDYVSPPAWHAGYLWWVEFPAGEIEPNTGTANLHLRRALADLTEPETIATVLGTFGGGTGSWDLGPDAAIAATGEALLFATGWIDNINFEVAGGAAARFPWVGTGAATADEAGLGLAHGLEASGGGAVGLAVPSHTLRAITAELGGDSLARWPTTDDWALAGGFGGANAAVTANGATALLYGLSYPDDMPTVIEAASTATSGQPAARVVVQNHPELGYAPTLLYFMG